MGVQAYRTVVQCSKVLLQPALPMVWVALISLNTDSVGRERDSSSMAMLLPFSSLRKWVMDLQRQKQLQSDLSCSRGLHWGEEEERSEKTK